MKDSRLLGRIQSQAQDFRRGKVAGLLVSPFSRARHNTLTTLRQAPSRVPEST